MAKNTRDAPSEKSVTEADLTAAAVNKAILKKTVTHPMTTYPVALGVLALIWSVVIKVSEPSVIATLLGFGVGAASWVVNFFIRGEVLTAEHVASLKALHKESQENDIRQLVVDCQQSEFPEGAKEADELIAAYQQLHDYLVGLQKKGNPSAERYLFLAEDAFQQGVKILQTALGTHRALQGTDIDRLEREVTTWRRQLPLSASREALQQRIDANQATINQFREHQAEVETALAESNELENALKQTYLNLTTLSAVGGSGQFAHHDGEAQGRLLTAVRAAKAVEDRLNKLGRPDTSADQMYAEAGKQVDGNR
jgi:uncharacterized membrane-anchored protein YhcB (DUF1043 family)